MTVLYLIQCAICEQMSRLDLVVFGATGLAGKQVVTQMVNLAKKYELGTWAVAGRSRAKVDALIAEVSKKTGSYGFTLSSRWS